MFASIDSLNIHHKWCENEEKEHSIVLDSIEGRQLTILIIEDNITIWNISKTSVLLAYIRMQDYIRVQGPLTLACIMYLLLEMISFAGRAGVRNPYS